MPDFITIRHPNVVPTARTTQEDFDSNLAERGWEVIEDAPLKALADQTAKELKATAGALGVDVTGLTSKGDLIAAIEAESSATDQG